MRWTGETLGAYLLTERYSTQSPQIVPLIVYFVPFDPGTGKYVVNRSLGCPKVQLKVFAMNLGLPFRSVRTSFHTLVKIVVRMWQLWDFSLHERLSLSVDESRTSGVPEDPCSGRPPHVIITSCMSGREFRESSYHSVPRVSGREGKGL